MNFNDIFFKKEDFDVLLLQPNMLQQIDAKYVDPVQIEYWNSLEKVGSLFGDLPIEPNWGLLYIAASLKANGIKTGLLDLHLYDYIKYTKTNNFIDEADIKKLLELKNFKLIGISSMTLSHVNALKIAQIAKEVNPQCKIVLGGIHFSFLAEKTLAENPFIDGVLAGEGEKSFVELFKYIDCKSQWDTIEGLSYRDQERIHVKDGYPLIKELDSLPYPDYDLWPEDVPLIPRIYTSRGCNGGCSYCVVNKFFCNKYRKRSNESVLEEINYLVKKYNVTDVLIGDLNFAANVDEAINFCERLAESGLNLKWWCQTRPDGLNETLIEKMAKAGCKQIGIGIESVDDDILDSIMSQKSNPNLNTEELCRMIKKHGISVQGYFILGLPGENIKTALSTIKCIDKLTKEGLVDVSHIAVMVPYPGTPIFNEALKFGIEIVDDDFSKYLMNCDFMNAGVPVVRTKYLSNYQIYTLWQLALSTAAKNFNSRLNFQRNNMFNELDKFWDKIEAAF
ncbi:MAG: B12-binding domain-containing radical SAM protein [Clostridiales bacterium]|nr:B12-binding domain-containing radical SAM protein [Clostridiales bacterium]